MNIIEKKIYDTLEVMYNDNLNKVSLLYDIVSLEEYSELVRGAELDGKKIEIWSEALQRSVDAHEVTVIPPRDEPYYIDAQIIIKSNRRIEAQGATIVQTPDCNILMFRNSHTADGTHAPVNMTERDCNISIDGGTWMESRRHRAGYGSSGKYDEERSLFGVSTLFFFNNMDNLTLTNITFAHTAGFAVQAGDISCAVFEHIRFNECYADGLHINGNTEKIICRDVKGEVGDDLIALNMYDWQNSSVDFGPMDTVLCDELELAQSSGYKAMRIEPGVYAYKDGTKVDCSLKNAIIKNVSGIATFKLYFQTPGYKIGTSPEWGEVGSADNIFFENITVDLNSPIDHFDSYMNSDPLRGTFAAFEVGANIGLLSFKNIDLKLYKEKYPYSYLVCIGPKSIVSGDYEVFDPYLSSKVQRLELCNIKVNGEKIEAYDDIVREISFDDINSDGNSTGNGKFEEILMINND